MLKEVKGTSNDLWTPLILRTSFSNGIPGGPDRTGPSTDPVIPAQKGRISDGQGQSGGPQRNDQIHKGHDLHLRGYPEGIGLIAHQLFSCWSDVHPPRRRLIKTRIHATVSEEGEQGVQSQGQHQHYHQ